MNFKSLRIRGVIVLSFALVITLAIVFTAMSAHGAARAAGSPTITSDKADYAPGSPVTLTGAGWASGEAVHIYVNDSVGNTWSLNSNPDPTADGNGGFTYQFTLPNTFIANYSVTATGPTSGIATTTFTDAPSANVNLDQFANLPGKGWQNGDINGNNSAYQEGRVVPFRLTIDGLSGGSHTIDINYDFTASGHEAYDFLATYNATEPADVCSTVSTPASALCPVGTPNTLAFPADPFAPGGQTASGKTVDGAIAFSGLSSRQLSMWGGTPLSFTCVPPDGTYTCSGSVAHQAAGSGNSSADITLTFNTGSCTTNCSVLLAWGGHLAQSAYWTQSATGPNPGGPNGAGQISGAPFHMRTQQLDGAGNKNQDRSIQPSAIVTTLTVNKILSPSNDPGLFNLLINGTAHATNVGNGGTTGAVIISAGSNSASETAGTNTSLSDYTSTFSCVDPQNNVVASGSGTSLSVTIISGINVTCTFTNTRKLSDLTVTKTATPSLTRTYTWGISKSVDQSKQTIAAGGSATFNYTVKVTHDSGTDSDWQVNGTITVTNPNTQDFTGVNVTDAIDNGGNCTVTGGSNVTVPASGHVDLPYTCTYASAPSPTSGTNTATATWDNTTYNTPDSSAQGTATYDFSNAQIKVVDGSVSVTDTLGGTLGTASYTDSSPKSFPYPYTFNNIPTGTCTDYPNTATFTTSDTGTTSSAGQSVTVCVAEDLGVSKTAQAGFTRDYNWKISKAVDKTFVEQIGGGTATFNYTVTVTQTATKDTGWHVSGTIYLTNPNDFFDFTGVNVADVVDFSGTCTIIGGTNVTVPAGLTKGLAYSCSYSSQPTYSTTGTNTATATWDSTAFNTPDNSASGHANFTFNTGSYNNPKAAGNKLVTVTDTFNSTTTTLGTVTATDTSPFASQTYQYPRTINVPQFGCASYTNTASLVEAKKSSNRTVKVCGPANTGAMTLAFWQSTNGQNFITSGASTAGVCNSGTWLQQYAPFQDLSATATCSDVATYVSNVITAATKSGSSMNARLKAQMLATALDVYFSDGSLGGNVIGAPAPIGGVTIDLHKICQMTDSSSGTATCTGKFSNVSSAFGGAASLTVSQMLTFAASQSNIGGSTWYSNVTTSQTLAKNAFDSINNQVAFAP